MSSQELFVREVHRFEATWQDYVAALRRANHVAAGELRLVLEHSFGLRQRGVEEST